MRTTPRMHNNAGMRAAANRRPNHDAVTTRAAPATAAPAERAGSEVDQIRATRLITAVKTPYLRNGKFDLRTYDAFLEHQIANGVEGVIVGGTTGEGQLMSWDEHIMLIAHTVNAFGDSLKVIGNTGSNSTREAMHATDQGFNVGMHASLQINPYYGKTSRGGMIKHFERVLDLGPAMVYNVPSRTGQDISPDVIEELAGHNHFIGVKECVGNDRIAHYANQGISCWSGNDDEAHDARHSAGAVGVVSVTSNVIPSVYAKLMGEEAQPELNAKIQDFVAWLFAEPNPIGVNTCLAMTGVVQPVFRLPYAPYDVSMQRKGMQLMQTLGVDVMGGLENVRVIAEEDFVLLDSF